MRHTDREKEEILRAVRRFDVSARVLLFGSRTDDSKKGGDIDLLVFSDTIGAEEKRRIRRMVCDAIGDRKFDLLVAADSLNPSDPFVRLALDTGIPLPRKDKAFAVLERNIEGMRKSLHWLRRSHEKCLRIGIKDGYTEEEFDDFENLVSRFARSVDMVVNKVFRSIDWYCVRFTGKPEHPGSG